MATHHIPPRNHKKITSDIDSLLFTINVHAALVYLGFSHAQQLACEAKPWASADFLHLNLGTPGLDERDSPIEFGLEHLLNAAQDGKATVRGFISGCLEEAVERGIIDNLQLIQFQQRWLA